MAVHRLVVVGVIQQDEEAVLGILARWCTVPPPAARTRLPDATAISMPGCTSSLAPVLTWPRVM